MNNIKEVNNIASYQAVLKEQLDDLSNSLQKEVHSTINKQMESWAADQFSSLPSKTFSNMSRQTKVSKCPSNNSTERKIPSKVFVPRQSLLTDLFTIDHIKGIYNIFIATLCIMFIHEILEESVITGSIRLDLSLMSYSFGKFDQVLQIAFYMELFTIFFVYLCFYFWSRWRWTLTAVFDVSGLCIYVTYLILFLHLPVQSLIHHELPPTSSFIILCEQTRLIMKTWAFVRTNCPRARKYTPTDTEAISCPGFSNYLYFLFAPTLVYRDEYPRNKTCNWNKVFTNLAHVAGCMLYANFLFSKFCLPAMKRFGKEEYSQSKLIVAIFSCCFPGALLFLLGFFLLLHCWMNAFAEMLRFADRMFYKDWWNSTSYSMFYRTWNCVVHDWLYEYVYKEMCDLHKILGVSFRNGKYLAMFTVFFTSSLVHEYILAFSFRFFYPVLLLMFGGFGSLMMFMNTNSSKFNIFFWFTLIIGQGILLCLYFMEWYARIDCAPITNDFLDFFIPRSWFCHSISS